MFFALGIIYTYLAGVCFKESLKAYKTRKAAKKLANIIEDNIEQEPQQ